MPFAFLTGKVKQRDRAELPSESWSEFEKRNGRERKKTHRMSSKKNNSKPGERIEWKEGGKTTTEWEKKTWILCDIKSWWNSVKDQLSDVNLLAKRWICLEWKLISRQKPNNRRKSRGTKHKEKKYSREIDFFFRFVQIFILLALRVVNTLVRQNWMSEWEARLPHSQPRSNPKHHRNKKNEIENNGDHH